MKKKIFSGVQPTGNLHLGNYLGAIKNFVELNNDAENDCIFCVVDLHAITVKQDPSKLRDNIRETVATFIACGINPEKNIIFNQSSVSAHSEAAWLLSCIARIGWLNRMTQFKEKAGQDKEKVSIGLYSYPILMAADILLYDATHVPVGDDQKQHLELCRDIAHRFNNDFKVPNFLKVPEPLIQKQFSRIMSLKDGTKKMSKSELSDLVVARSPNPNESEFSCLLEAMLALGALTNGLRSDANVILPFCCIELSLIQLLDSTPVGIIIVGNLCHTIYTMSPYSFHLPCQYVTIVIGIARVIGS